MTTKRRAIVRAFRSDDLRAAARAAIRNGWSSRLDGRNHLVLTSPDGSGAVRLSTTAFSSGATRAKVELLRRLGALPARPGRAARITAGARRRTRGIP